MYGQSTLTPTHTKQVLGEHANRLGHFDTSRRTFELWNNFFLNVRFVSWTNVDPTIRAEENLGPKEIIVRTNFELSVKKRARMHHPRSLVQRSRNEQLKSSENVQKTFSLSLSLLWRPLSAYRSVETRDGGWGSKQNIPPPPPTRVTNMVTVPGSGWVKGFSRKRANRLTKSRGRSASHYGARQGSRVPPRAAAPRDAKTANRGTRGRRRRARNHKRCARQQRAMLVRAERTPSASARLNARANNGVPNKHNYPSTYVHRLVPL